MKLQSLFLVSSLLFKSCSIGYTDTQYFKVTKNEVTNLTNYKFNNLDFLDTYYLGDSIVPYVAIEDFFVKFSGFFLEDVFSFKYTNNATKVQIKDTFYEIAFDFSNDKIGFYSTNSENYYLDYTNLTSNSSFDPVVNYDLIYKAKGTQTLPQNKELSLASYGLKIETVIREKERKTLVPIHVLDTIFFTTTKYITIYLNDGVYYLNEGPFVDGTEIGYKIRTSSINGKTQNNEFRKYTYNHMLFALDYFYGLKNYKNIDSYSNQIDNATKDLILSNNSMQNCRGYSKLVYGTLGEMHSGILGTSFYAPLNKSINRDFVAKNDFGPNVSKYYEAKAEFKELMDNAPIWPSMSNDPVLIKDDLAIISLDSFSIVTKDHYIPEIPTRYEAYNIMSYAMNKIKKDNNVKHIILDLSRNGGGLVVSMYLTLSFLTNETLQYTYFDSFKNNTTQFEYTFDTDLDGDFNDNDSFDNYNWNILISPLSFSAGNLLPFITKENNFATILGQTSGGGMCTVNYLALADGTSMQISSTEEVRVKDKNNNLQPVEQGCEPDIVVSHDNFYDVDYYLNLLN